MISTKMHLALQRQAEEAQEAEAEVEQEERRSKAMAKLAAMSTETLKQMATTLMSYRDEDNVTVQNAAEGLNMVLEVPVARLTQEEFGRFCASLEEGLP